jgi:hypothetical protein
LKQREIRGDSRIPIEVETLLQAAIEFEAIARRGNQRSLDDVGALAVGVFGHETDTVAHLKAFGVGQRHLLIPMIAIDDELVVTDGSLKSTESGPLPMRRTFD